MKLLPFGLSLLATLTISACSGSSVDVDPVPTDPISTPGEVSTDQLPGPQARLKTLGNSETFYSALEEALINRSGNFSDDESSFEVGTTAEIEAAPQSSPNGADGSGVGGNEVTSTNIQETGVDEQDRVKLNAAGSQLFVLSSEFPDFNQPQTQDTDSTNNADEPVTIPVDGPQELNTTLRILTLDSETPDATSVNDLSIDLQGQAADGLYLYETGEQSSAVITASGSGYWSYWGSPLAFAELQSIIVKVDVNDAVNASITDTVTIDGQIISSRRIGDSLFFASRYYPQIPGSQPGQLSADEWRKAVEAADLSKLLPTYSRNGSDESIPLVDASTCFVAPVSADQQYYSPDIISLGVIDLTSMQLRGAECFLGATETLYASTDSVFLATTQYSYDQGPMTIDGAPVDVDIEIFDPDLEWSDPRVTTDIHQFDIQSGQLSYAGSGAVRGHLGWNDLQKPFRMSASAGYLRVATMNDQQGPDHSPILLHILQPDGEGDLQSVSALPNDSRPQHIGEPGEQLYASRFIGDQAYLVTFRQTDPLYVIDLSDPADPEVKGELKIEGYSDYLHPVDENLLLGIGKDAVPDSSGLGDGRGAWVQGMKLSLFDVSDPGNPTELQSILIGERGTDSVALRNHRAITVQPATELHPMRISFGIDVFGEPVPTSSPSQSQASIHSPWNYTGLHGFDVIAGSNASIIPRGALIIDRANGADRFYAGFGDDRSVMVNDAVFYVYGNTVYPVLWDNLDSDPVAR